MTRPGFSTSGTGKSYASGSSTGGAFGTDKGETEPQMEGDIYITSVIKNPTEVLCIKYTPDRALIAAGLTDGNVCLYSFSTGKIVRTLTNLSNIAVPVTAIKHRPVHKGTDQPTTLLATYVDGFVRCWEFTTGTCIYSIQENRQILGISYHNHLSKFITVGDDTRVYLYDEETRTLERSYESSDSRERMDGHVSRVFAACFNPKSQHEFVTGGWDDTLHFWDIRLPRSTRHLYGVHMCGDGIDISRTGKEILTCSWQKVQPLQLWDYGTGKLLQAIVPDIHESVLYCGKFATKELFACGGSEPNLLRIVDQRQMTTLASIRGLPGGVYSLDIGTSKIKRAKQKGKSTSKMGNLYSIDGVTLPKFAFCSGKKLYEIDFI